MMEIWNYSGLLFGIVGWIATIQLVRNTRGLSVIQRSALVVSGLIVWMIAGFGTLVHRGALSADTATVVGGTVCMIMGGSLLARGWSITTQRHRR